jgi:hypothetical protein
MVLNTGSLEPPVAAAVIVKLKDARIGPEAEAAGLRIVADRLLGQSVVTAVVYEKRISVHFLEAVCVDGTVSLHGVTNYQPAIEAAVAAAQAVPGVRSVRSEIQVVQEYSVLP